MIALDTNVLVRCVEQDDPVQSAAAAALVRRHSAKAASMFLANEVLAETVWVLRTAYRRNRSDVASLMERLVATAAFTFEDDDLVRRAVRDYRRTGVDFADLLLVHKASAAGTSLASFDRNLARAFPGRVRLPAAL